MKTLFILAVLMLTLNETVYAQDAEEKEDGLVTPAPVSEFQQNANYPVKYGQVFTDTVLQMIEENELDMFDAGQQLSGEFSRAVEAKKKLNHCHKFIQADGNTGEWGQIIEASLDRLPQIRSELMSDAAGNKAGMDLVCPRFGEMNEKERKEFWVWTMTTLALFESTCGFDTTNPANPNAVGIYQLHTSTADRMPRASVNNKVCGTMSGAEVAKPGNNIVCTMDFIRDSFSGRFEHAPAGLITRAQQFERLRSSTNSIIKVLQKFKVCQSNYLQKS